MSNLRTPVIHLSNVLFGWNAGAVVLDIPELIINQGEKVFIRGPSGSGKTTLLGLLGGVLTAQSGVNRPTIVTANGNGAQYWPAAESCCRQGADWSSGSGDCG